ncbi:MAG: DUF1501 domain-containing protein [Planctomycetaceae bacterium]|nr:DUF1501 domain-containing protein [Planctomycetaceae bacterium]
MTPHYRKTPRRAFLADLGMGFTGLALGSMLAADGIGRASAMDGARAHAAPSGRPHHAPRAKSVIWIFLVGGMSHLESFDYKPALNQYAGVEIGKTPYADVLTAQFTENLRVVVPNDANGQQRLKLFPLQVGFRKRGQSGLEISDWWPHLGTCADDLAVVRSMWTTDNNHGAQLQFHTGRHSLEGRFPTLGSWAHYGLGSLNDNLPQFVVLGTPLADCCGGVGGHGAAYLGPQHAGVQMGVDPRTALPYSSPGDGVFVEEQTGEFALLRKLNDLTAVEYPGDANLLARIKSYELAYQMQSAVPEVVDCSGESRETEQLYGLGGKSSQDFGRQCLVARRLVERGVRFVQIFHGSNGGAGAWDGHSKLKTGHENLCRQVDQPIAGLIQDLKRRGMLEETLVVIGTEFGRTPGSQGADGRDHHPFAFSVAMAGGGVRGGLAHGATDALGFHAVEDRHYVTDLHATVLHQLGLDPRRLEIPGRKRLEIDFGKPMQKVIS